MLDWQEFLNQQKLDDGPLPDCALTDLSHIGLIQVSGEDARDFLQGQFTNDINRVDATHSQLSAYCGPKGRMLASFRILERNDALLLMLPAERIAAIRKRLHMFVLRAKVKIEDVSDRLVRIELSGDCVPDLLPIDPPNEDNGVHMFDGYTVIRIPGDRPRFQVLGESGVMQSLWEEAAATTRPVSSIAWALLDIRAGIPAVCEATVECFVPQMTNLHVIEGVSFTKGCYTGQEIVARMHYLGRLKRRMYRVRIDSAQQPVPGKALYSPHSSSDQGTGRIVSSAPSPDGGHEALAVIEIAAAETGEVYLGAADGPRLTFLDLPYTVASG